MQCFETGNSLSGVDRRVQLPMSSMRMRMNWQTRLCLRIQGGSESPKAIQSS